jgi:cation/acetate symporter
VTLTIQIFLVAIGAVYLWAGAVRLTRPISEFYVAGGRVPPLLNGMTIAVSFVGVLVFAALAGALGEDGSGRLMLLLASTGGLLVGGLLIAPYLRKFGGYTVPDFLGERFGANGVRPLGVVAVILCSFPALAAVLFGLGLIITRFFAVGIGAAIAAGSGLLLVCTLLGGVRSASRTEIAQYALLLAASLAALAIPVWQTGTAFPDLALEDTLPKLSPADFAVQDLVNRIALAFCLVAGTASLPHLLMRGFTTPNARSVRNGFLLSLPFAAALCMVAPAYAAFFGAPPTASTERSVMLLQALLAAGASAVLLASGSGLLLAIANSLSYDIFYKAVQPMASTGRRILIARASVVFVLGLAAFAAFAVPDKVLPATEAAFSLAASAFLPALVLGVWWKRTTGEGALAGMLAGLVVCLYYLLAPRYFPFAFYETSSFLSNASENDASAYDRLREIYYLADPAAKEAIYQLWKTKVDAIANWGGVKETFAAIFAVPLGVLVTVGVSLFTPAPDADVQRFVDELRKPEPPTPAPLAEDHSASTFSVSQTLISD